MPNMSTATASLAVGAGLLVAVGLGAYLVLAGNSSCPDGHLRAEYFSNPTLSGEPTMVRCEAQIDMDWQFAGPDTAGASNSFISALAGPPPGMPEDGFSVRWTGEFNFAESDYVLTAGADDGIRVWIDDQLIIDAWRESPYTEAIVELRPAAGTRIVRVDYYENIGTARARVAWQLANLSALGAVPSLHPADSDAIASR
jgi:hypothetical protein